MVEQSSAVGLGAAQEVIRIALELQAETKGMNKLTATTSRLEKEMERLKNKTGEMQGATQEYFETNIQPQALNTLRESLRASAGSLTGLLRTSRELRPNVEQMGLSMGEFRMEVEAAAQRIRPFKFAFLGLMFIGMQITRVMSGMFRDMFQGFRNSQEANSQFNTAMSRLGAQIQYVKFLFMDAFVNSPLFDRVISGIRVVLDYFAGLDDSTKRWIGYLSIGLFAIGAILFTVGTVGAAVNSLVATTISLTGYLSATTAPAYLIAVKDAATAALGKIYAATVATHGWAMTFGLLGWAAGALFFTEYFRNLRRFEGDTEQAFSYTANQAGIIFLEIGKGAVWIVGTVLKAVSAAVGFIVDVLLTAAKAQINNLITYFQSILRVIGRFVPAAKSAANALSELRPDDSFKLDNAEKFLNFMDGGLQKSLDGLTSQQDKLRGFLDLHDKIHDINTRSTFDFDSFPSLDSIGVSDASETYTYNIDNLVVQASDPQQLSRELEFQSRYEELQRMRNGV